MARRHAPSADSIGDAGIAPSEMALIESHPMTDNEALALKVKNVRFATTRLRAGYDEGQVDDFLDALSETFLGVRRPPLTPEDIHHASFGTTTLRPGYDQQQVDAFLDEIAPSLAGLPAAGGSTSA